MQNNGKYYTFLVRHSSPSKIKIRRIKISKGFLHLSSIGLFLFIGFSVLAFGIAGMFRPAVFARELDQASASVSSQITDLDRSPQQSFDDVASNAGGPELGDENDSEDPDVAARLKAASAGMDPQFLPTVWPHEGKINNEFGFRRNPFGGRAYEFHPGMDIDGERGEPVYAPANGTITKAGLTGGYGNMIEIDHGHGIATRYGHLSKIEIELGDIITRGQLIGYIGSTGRSTGPHLHFELRLNDRPINPRHFLPQETTDVAVK